MAHIVINGLSLRPGGGLQVLTAILAGMISKERGHRYTVLWSDLNSEKFLKEKFKGQADINFINPVGTSNNMRLFFWQMTRLKRVLTKLKADVLIGLNHHFPSGSVAQIIYHVNVLRFDRPRKRLLERGEFADRLRDWRTMRGLKSARANVFESSYLQDLASNRVAKINNPSLIYIGLEHQDNIQPSNFKPSRSPILLSLTSAHPHKDNATLLKTLAILNERRPDVNWMLKIAGGTNPKTFSDMHRLADSLGISEQIDWLGFQSHENLAKLGSEALCLVSTSRVESFCMVALEAMSWSCPVIVTNATSMPESIGVAGLLAEPGDVDGFAENIISLFENKELRQKLVNNGYVHIQSMTWETAADSFEDIIHALEL